MCICACAGLAVHPDALTSSRTTAAAAAADPIRQYPRGSARRGSRRPSSPVRIPSDSGALLLRACASILAESELQCSNGVAQLAVILAQRASNILPDAVWITHVHVRRLDGHGLSGCRLRSTCGKFAHASARDGAGKAFAWQPALDRRAQARRAPGYRCRYGSRAIPEGDEVFRVDIAGRAGRGRTAAEPAEETRSKPRTPALAAAVALASRKPARIAEKGMPQPEPTARTTAHISPTWAGLA